MKILVHFGAPKTGSTSLQESLASARKSLEKAGVLFPDLSKVTNDRISARAHHVIYPLFKDSSAWHDGEIQRFGGHDQLLNAAETAWAEIKRQIAKKKPKLLILSSEKFFRRIDCVSVKRFNVMLAEISTSIVSVIYLRSPADLYLSACQQHVKHRFEFLQPQPTRYREEIEHIREHLHSELHVRAFEKSKLIGNDLVTDFITNYLSEYVSPKMVPSQKANISLSAETMELLCSYKWMPSNPKLAFKNNKVNQFKRKIIRQEKIIGERYRKPKLLPHLRTEINNASTELIWLQSEFNITFSNVNYANINGNPIKNINSYSRVQDIAEVNWKIRDDILFRILEKEISANSKKSFFSKIFRKLLLYKLRLTRPNCTK